ncbi:hypothetical protein VIGAN_07198500 [Vigna angularis var. angularis]|uniref:Uncharacterized protein n=1 Tax=Vigna angularis var. angularis TaxID=157739 RepID=A0A0S3SJR2_PHAAN|nr:hypothetical protein VIGAN_07198500 [Vigna angularis var. angularis]
MAGCFSRLCGLTYPSCGSLMRMSLWFGGLFMEYHEVHGRSVGGSMEPQSINLTTMARFSNTVLTINVAPNTRPKFKVLRVEELLQSICCPSTPRPTYFETSSSTKRTSCLVAQVLFKKFCR